MESSGVRNRTPEPPNAVPGWPRPGGAPESPMSVVPDGAAACSPSASATPTFTSNFSAFNLPPPRHIPPQSPSQSQASMQVDGEQQPLFNRRLATSPGGFSTSSSSLFGPTTPFLPILPFSTVAYRKQSMLASEPPLLPSANPVSDDEQDQAENGGDDADREGSDSPMIIGSPPFDSLSPLPPFHSLQPGPQPFPTRQSRSRSTSESMGGSSSINFGVNGNGGLGHGSIPASPVMVARALQGQRTPPPFLQRRLFNETQDGMAAEEGEERGANDMGLGLVGGNGSGSGSGSGSEENGRVVRRPVSRKPNLLPKPKSHLRVLADLRNEDGPADQLEIASEATLHRLSRSGASTVPGLRPTPLLPPTSLPSSSSHVPTRPTPNRFPEHATEDEAFGSSRAEEKSSDEDGEDAEAGSDWGGMSLGGYGTEDEEERRASIWTGIRGAGMGGSGMGINTISGGKSPGSERGRMEIEINSPSTPSWHASARPGKRKSLSTSCSFSFLYLTHSPFRAVTNDERFEPYAQAFKRRAVSPAASGGSPILSFAQHASIPTPPALPTMLPLSLSASSAVPISHSLPISIPSPTLGPHHSFFSAGGQGKRSRAGSPGASSLSSSAGRSGGQGFLSGSQTLGMVMSGRLDREEEKNGLKANEAGDALGSMSLG
ncbi:hypothetical protein P7C70_g2140, partial [Phenoliferia sp. Uapishka_3]